MRLARQDHLLHTPKLHRPIEGRLDRPCRVGLRKVNVHGLEVRTRLHRFGQDLEALGHTMRAQHESHPPHILRHLLDLRNLVALLKEGVSALGEPLPIPLARSCHLDVLPEEWAEERPPGGARLGHDTQRVLALEGVEVCIEVVPAMQLVDGYAAEVRRDFKEKLGGKVGRGVLFRPGT